ncbi:transporter substrate-binding domain-containing protein [Corticimicrobacter populi]|uniref:Amino acid ABC transporter n=1 Tax=Corticimicrobacter populi TaxID=2175229 RepID=A0A2V1JXR4_9BURK|nr:transporter substrate-binding domain-containing protein [Corticimicrobacter populi]PWF21798.1 amino acid ABC transporter [Corticimicrobacter populi]
MTTRLPFSERHPSRARHLLSILGASLLCLFARTALADATLEQIHSRGKLVAGVVLSGPPFGTIDPATQQHIGYNVELSRAIADALGVTLETVQVQPSNRVQFLQQNKVDILIANMQWTQERADILSFVPTPFEEVGGALVTRRNSGITQWEDVRAQPVCLSQGSNFAKPLTETYGAQLKAFRSQAESLLALRGGNCVAAVHVSPTLRNLVATNPDWQDYATPLDTDLIPSPSVIWLRKGETDTQAAIDRIVQDWHRTGWLIDTGKRNGMTPTARLYELHEQFKRDN